MAVRKAEDERRKMRYFPMLRELMWAHQATGWRYLHAQAMNRYASSGQ